MIVFSDYIPSQTKYINTCILGIQMVGYYIFKNLHVGCNVDSPLPNAKFISLVGVSCKYKRKFNVIWFFLGLNIKLIIMVFLNNRNLLWQCLYIYMKQNIVIYKDDMMCQNFNLGFKYRVQFPIKVLE